MNNNQRKLFNAANKVEKLLYEGGMTDFHKTVYCSYITISLKDYVLRSQDIDVLNTILKSMSSVNVSIYMNSTGCLKLELW